MKLVPLGDRVVLKQLVAEETTKSGIILTGQAKYRITGSGTGKTTTGRSNRCRSWRSS